MEELGVTAGREDPCGSNPRKGCDVSAICAPLAGSCDSEMMRELMRSAQTPLISDSCSPPSEARAAAEGDPTEQQTIQSTEPAGMEQQKLWSDEKLMSG